MDTKQPGLDRCCEDNLSDNNRAGLALMCQENHTDYLFENALLGTWSQLQMLKEEMD